MAYEITWQIHNKVLCLKLMGAVSKELHIVNDEMLTILNDTTSKIVLLLDVEQFETEYQSANRLRDTQKYMNHPHLSSVLCVSSDKLNRLIMLMAFGLSRAQLFRFETMQQALSSPMFKRVAKSNH